jgi:hypothetical protein
VPACSSENEEVNGLKFAHDLVLDLSWKRKEGAGASVCMLLTHIVSQLRWQEDRHSVAKIFSSSSAEGRELEC